MITVNGQGRLIDFDLAREENYSGARRTIRTVRLLVSMCLGRLANEFLNVAGYVAVYVHSAAVYTWKGSRTMR